MRLLLLAIGFCAAIAASAQTPDDYRRPYDTSTLEPGDGPFSYRSGMEHMVVRCPWHRWEFAIDSGEAVGQITTKMLETMNVGWAYFPTEETDVVPAIEKAGVLIATCYEGDMDLRTDTGQLQARVKVAFARAEVMRKAARTSVSFGT